MKIVKYKKTSKGCYKVFLDNDKELLLYEEVILQFDLLLKKEIDESTMLLVDQCNQKWDVYYVALHSIQNRFRSIQDLKEQLIHKEYPMELVEEAVSKLIEQGYLNDQEYAKSYIHTQMITTNKGPFRLEKELLEKKIPLEFIQEGLLLFTEEEQLIRIHKLIEKGIKSNHTKGGVVLKQKIYHELKTLGYDISLINQEICQFSFENDEEIAKKEYEKLYRKYSRKYKGEELRKKIQEKLYLKGLSYEE